MALHSKHISIEELLSLEARKDSVYAAVKENLFTMHDGFFGSFVPDFKDPSYSIDCIKGTSPKVYKLKKLLYLGRFISVETCDNIFVFADSKMHDLDLRFSGYALVPKSRFSPITSNWSQSIKLTTDIFLNIDNRHLLDQDLLAANKEDGLKICRELNSTWKNDLRFVNFKSQAPYVKKTLKSMMKQLNDFMKSDYMVDASEEIEKDLTRGAI